MSPLSRLLPAVGVTAVLLVGAGACGGDSDPGAAPTTVASPTASPAASSTTTAAEDPLLAAVVSLQKISADFGARFETLDGFLQDTRFGASGVQDAAVAYDADRTAYLDAIGTTVEQSSGAGPEIQSASTAFEADARETVQHADNVLNFRISASSCSSAAKISPMSATAAVRTAKTCQETVAFFSDSTVPELRAYARGYDHLMDRRIKIYGGIAPAGDSADDTVDLLGDMTEALAQTTKAFAAFEPTLAAVPAALDAQIGAVRLAETYPALLALVEAPAGSNAGSGD